MPGVESTALPRHTDSPGDQGSWGAPGTSRELSLEESDKDTGSRASYHAVEGPA